MTPPFTFSWPELTLCDGSFTAIEFCRSPCPRPRHASPCSRSTARGAANATREIIYGMPGAERTQIPPIAIAHTAKRAQVAGDTRALLKYPANVVACSDDSYLYQDCPRGLAMRLHQALRHCRHPPAATFGALSPANPRLNRPARDLFR